MKKVVVVYKVSNPSGVDYTEEMEFATKHDWITVLNKEDGLLIINDVTDNPTMVEAIGVFNKNVWQSWRDITGAEEADEYEPDKDSQKKFGEG